VAVDPQTWIVRIPRKKGTLGELLRIVTSLWRYQFEDLEVLPNRVVSTVQLQPKQEEYTLEKMLNYVDITPLPDMSPWDYLRHVWARCSESELKPITCFVPNTETALDLGADILGGNWLGIPLYTAELLADREFIVALAPEWYSGLEQTKRFLHGRAP
jgi:hypothetical protein